MNWRTHLSVIAAAVVFVGCDKIPFLSKEEAAEPPQAEEVQPAPAETQPARAAQQQPPQAPSQREQPAARQPARPRQVSLAGEEPWIPADTGTIAPGMSRDQVVSTWGAPVVERSLGRWTYMHFRNGCEQSCGTFDVVFLEDGQVVDAVVRGRGHYYSGVSSSPASRTAAFTPPQAGREPSGLPG